MAHKHNCSSSNNTTLIEMEYPYQIWGLYVDLIRGYTSIFEETALKWFLTTQSSFDIIQHNLSTQISSAHFRSSEAIIEICSNQRDVFLTGYHFLCKKSMIQIECQSHYQNDTAVCHESKVANIIIFRKL